MIQNVVDCRIFSNKMYGFIPREKEKIFFIKKTLKKLLDNSLFTW